MQDAAPSLLWPQQSITASSSTTAGPAAKPHKWSHLIFFFVSALSAAVWQALKCQMWSCSHSVQRNKSTLPLPAEARLREALLLCTQTSRSKCYAMMGRCLWVLQHMLNPLGIDSIPHVEHGVSRIFFSCWNSWSLQTSSPIRTDQGTCISQPNILWVHTDNFWISLVSSSWKQGKH